MNGAVSVRPAAPMKRVLVGERLLALCQTHAAQVLEAGVETLEELRALFGEPEGQRSFVDRRAPLDRRAFPPRPEGRRHDFGRRSTDP